MKIRHFKPKHQKNSLFLKVMIAVGALMTAALILAGGIMVTQAILPSETEFEAAPPAQQNQVEPEKQKRKVITKNVQKRSSSLVKRINVVQPQHINTPQVEITLPSGMGGEGTDGMGISDFSGMTNLSAMKIDLPEMDIFGAKAKSDRIFIAFETSEKTMTDDMGGLEAFNIVRDEIKKLVSMLPATCVFNVMAFDLHVKEVRDMCNPNLVPATAVNKDRFVKWIDAINKDVNKIGLWYGDRQYDLKYPIPPFADAKVMSYHYDGAQYFDVVCRYKVYQTAIEQGAGAIWILTMRWPEPNDYFLPKTPDEQKKFNAQWEKNCKDFVKKGGIIADDADKDAWNKWIKSTEPARMKAKEWLDKENERRRSKGIPQRVITDMLVLANELKLKYPPKPTFRNDLRPHVDFKRYTQSSLFASYAQIFKKVYDERGLKRPILNIILLSGRKTKIDNKKLNKIRSWAKLNNNGSVRILRAGKPVSEYENFKEDKEEKK